MLHIEVQGQVQADFAARMYTYAALLHLRLWRQRRKKQSAEQPPLILGLALLTDGQADWRPGPYEARAFGLGVRYDYRVVKLLDWQDRRDELATTTNPVALVINAWLSVLAARGRTDDLLAVARAAWRQARRGGYSSAH